MIPRHKASLIALVGVAFATLSGAHARMLLQEEGSYKNATKWDYEGANCPSQLGGGGGGGGYYYPAMPLPATSVAAGGGAMMPTAVASAAMPAGARASAAASVPTTGAAAASTASAAAEGTLGFRTGGAQDVENFRENLKAGYLPLVTDVSFTGIVKDYMFDTSSPGGEPCRELFCPLYSVGVSPDPMLQAEGGEANASDVYMAVGLDSGIQASSFQRKQLNLVVVLDVSGSMDSPFNAYYYDSVTGKQEELKGEEATKTKLDVAKEVLQGIVDQLHGNDSLSVVLFSSGACTPLPLDYLSTSDVGQLKRQMDQEIVTVGSTNLQSGIDAAVKQLQGCQRCKEASKQDVENRVIIITDAQPNEGETSDEALLARLKALAYDGIYSTIIGVGLDFNTALVEEISKVRGALYFSVHSPGEFQRRLVQDFDYAVTPLVFDLTLAVESGSLATDGDDSGWRILHVYGSPNPNDTALSSDGTIMHIHTLFPSPKTEEGIKGGVVLLRMRPPQGGSRPLQLTAGYTDREGKQFSSKRTVALPAEASAGGSFYASSGVQKAVLLARYTDALQGWLLDEWEAVERGKGSDRPVGLIPTPYCTPFPRYYCPLSPDAYGLRPVSGGCVLEAGWLLPDTCLLPCPPPVLTPLLGRWERQSEKLRVGEEAKQAFSDFLPYFEGEVGRLGDATLGQEVDILKKLVAV